MAASKRKLPGPLGPFLSSAELKRVKFPEGALPADITKQHRPNDLAEVRYYYFDAPFTCKRCGTVETWTTEQQKRWYEVHRGDPHAVAVHCHECRKGKRA
jgi:Probable zinc-ribbon domain